MSYFTNVRNTTLSIFEGMSVTLSHLVRQPTTVQYPDRYPDGGGGVTQRLPERYRGLLEVDMDICTACLACEQACPIECINIVVEKDPVDKKRRYMSVFDIDMAKCMYCGLCSEPCPTDAIRHTREFQGALSHLEGLVFRFVPPGEQIVPYKTKKGVDPEIKGVGEHAQQAWRHGYDTNHATVEKMRELGVTGLEAAAAAAEGRAVESNDQKTQRLTKELHGEPPASKDEWRTWSKDRVPKQAGDAAAFAVTLPYGHVQGTLERAMEGTDCTACGYPTCREYAEAIADGAEKDASLCQPGGKVTLQEVTLILDLLDGKVPFAETKPDLETSQETK